MIIESIIIISIAILIIYKKKTISHSKNIDDVSNLNSTKIHEIFYVESIKDVQFAILEANRLKLNIVTRGEKHSMGGQSIFPNACVIDTKYMNSILKIDTESSYAIVEPGVTWADLIYKLNFYGYSPQILQSYASFSIGVFSLFSALVIFLFSQILKNLLKIYLAISRGRLLQYLHNLPLIWGFL